MVRGRAGIVARPDRPVANGHADHGPLTAGRLVTPPL